MTLRSQLVTLIIVLFAIAGCAPTEPAAQDTIPVTITRTQPTSQPTAAQDTVPISVTRSQPTPKPTATQHIIPITLTPAQPTATSTSQPTPTTLPAGTLTELLTADGRFSIFLSLLETAGMADLLNGAGPFTVFVPTNEAFNQSRPGSLETLLADPALNTFIQQHIVPELLTGTDISQANTYCDLIFGTYTLQGSTLQFGRNEYGYEVINIWDVETGDIPIAETDMAATNGVIHIITAPILPITSPLRYPTISNWLFNSDLNADRMVEALNDFGGPYYMWPCQEPRRLPALLAGEHPYTVLLPSDAAISAAASEFGVNFQHPVTFSDLVSYHLIEGTVSTQELQGEQSYQTLSGRPISISRLAPNILNINGVQVIILNTLEAENGVIYVIDKLLVPPDMDLANWLPLITGALIEQGRFSTVLTLLEEDSLDHALNHSGPFTLFVVPDSALTNLSPEQLHSLSNRRAAYDLYYLVEGELIDLQTTTQFEIGSEMYSSQTTVYITTLGATTIISNDEAGQATIVETIKASNGVIYVLDRPLLPTPELSIHMHQNPHFYV